MHVSMRGLWCFRADGQPTGYTLEEMTPEFVHYGKALPMALAPHVRFSASGGGCVCRSEGSPFTLCTVRCQLESVSSSIRNNYELQNMKRTADNAYKQFNKVRTQFAAVDCANAATNCACGCVHRPVAKLLVAPWRVPRACHWTASTHS